MIAFDLIFQLFNSVALIAVFLQPLSAEVVAVKQLFLEESHRFIIIFNTL